MATSFSPRLSLQTQLVALPQAHSLLQDFDMCRVFADLDLQDAANYAALEHVVRAGTSEEDSQAYYDLLPGDLAVALMMLFRRKEEVGPRAMKELEELVTDEHLAAMSPLPVYLVLYQLPEDGQLTRTVVEPEEAGHWPIVCCLQTPSLLCLLYPPGATFLDGYDAYTCELRDVLVPPSVLQSIRPSLSVHYQPVSSSVQTQTKRARSPVKESEAMGLGWLSNEKDLQPQPVSEASKSNSFSEVVPPPPVSNAAKPVSEASKSSSFSEVVPPPPVSNAAKPAIEAPKPIIQPTKTIVYEWKAPVRKSDSSQMTIQRIDQAHVNPSTKPLPLTITRKITIHKSKSSKSSKSRQSQPVTESKSRQSQPVTETPVVLQKADAWEFIPTPKPAAAQQSSREMCGTSECCLS